MFVSAEPRPGGAPVTGLVDDVAYFLAEGAPQVRWVFAPAVERAAANAPTLKIRPRELAVSAFHRAKLERVGEPLFSDVYALGRMLDARYALIPYGAGYVEARGRVEIALAIVDATDGDVVWTGVVAGETGAPGERATVASAATALARLLAR